MTRRPFPQTRWLIGIAVAAALASQLACGDAATPSTTVAELLYFRGTDLMHYKDDGSGDSVVKLNTDGRVAVWSPAGDRIAFAAAGTGGASDIFLINPDGSGEVNLTQSTAAESDPSWSPDGSHLAYRSDTDGDFEIWVMDSTGGSATQLTFNTAEEAYPRWSPGGNKIAFWSMRDGNGEIYTMNPDGNLQNNASHSPADDPPAFDWSHDGFRLALTRNTGSGSDILSVDPDGADSLNLTHGLATLSTQPDWSPTGGRIAFIGVADTATGPVVLTMNNDGSGITNIHRVAGPCCSTPVWSPGGGRLSYVQSNSGQLQVMISNSNGTSPRPVTAAGMYALPQWRPQ